MRVVHSRRCVVDEEGLVRRQRLLAANPLDRLVGDIGADVIVRVARRRNAGHAVVESRRVEVGLALQEPVELVEARMRRPAVERPRHAQLPRRQLVTLAELRRPIPVQPEHLGQRRDRVRPNPRHAGERRAHLRDPAHVRAVRVAAGQERHPRRRTDRSGVEVRVAQPALGEPVEGLHVDRPAEARGVGEPHVVDQHEHDVRRARPLRRLQLEARRRGRFSRVNLGDRRILRLRKRQDRSIRAALWGCTHASVLRDREMGGGHSARSNGRAR